MPPKKRPGQQQRRQPSARTTPRTAQQRAAGTAPARSFYTPGASPFRHAVEQRSAPLLILLRNMPRLFVMLLPLALFLLGLFLPLPYGYVALVLFFLFTGWLAYPSWPNADPRAKGLRVIFFALIIAVAVVRVVRG